MKEKKPQGEQDKEQQPCEESLCESISELKSRVEELSQELADRKKVEKAKWILVRTKGIDEEEAHRMLLNRSRAERRRLAEMAEIIIDGDRILNIEE